MVKDALKEEVRQLGFFSLILQKAEAMYHSITCPLMEGYSDCIRFQGIYLVQRSNGVWCRIGRSL